MIRWSDNDRRLGPITYAHRDDVSRFGVVLKSSDDEGDPAYGRLHLFGSTILWPMPGWMIRPHRTKVKFTHLSDADRERLGRDWYWDVHERAFGFTFADGALHTYFGAQTHEWPGSKSKVFFLPWRQWRHVRHSYYDMDGDLFAHVPDRDFDAKEKLQTACPVLQFDFLDFDGERITATTRIEEREWRLGEGWFRWLSLFRRNMVRRSLSIKFDKETGPEKGSWKGGTMGTGIDMLPGELHEAAFRRYCEQDHSSKYRRYRVTFVGRA